ncbi:MAG: hypothetical protein A3K83_01505 [Omnitrophica WOR_2 bacterium RBG_13_44_8b]|nr:MAG: hypothetical protein A3K83_01505 [Omnitrophica WOR_2 bacterium RBG_13_44_8b]
MLRRKILIVGFAISIVALFLLINFVRAKYVVPILMYHHVVSGASKENRVVVSPAEFQRQMRFLRNNQYNIVPLETVADLMRDKKKMPARTIAITLDDGNKDNYTHAFPILKKYNIPATMFIIIDEVGRSQGDKLSWDEIKAMHDSGLITFGSHCLGPEPLINIMHETEIKRQVFDSKKALEAKLGRVVTAFSYPEGLFNGRIKQLVMDAGYKLAVVTNPGRRFPNNDVFLLKRQRISSKSYNLFVFWLQSSGYYNLIKEYRKK